MNVIKLHRWIVVLFLISTSTLFAQPINGTFTVGGLNPSYETITKFIEDISQKGIDGPVVVNIRDGIYNEYLNLPYIQGSSKQNTITFQSETLNSQSVTLLYEPSFGDNQDKSSIVVDSLSNVVFQYLTIKNTSTSGNLIDIYSSVNFVFRHNIVEGELQNGIKLLYYEGDINGIQISNNIFKNGETALHLNSSNSLIGSGSGYSLTISNNEFNEQKAYSLMVFNLDSVLVQRNTIISQSEDIKGILFNGVGTFSAVKENKILLPSGGEGIRFENCEQNIIANNFISIGGNNYASGINTYDSYGIDILYNSVNIYNGNSQEGKCLNIFYGGDIRLFNNILANTGGGYSIYNYYNSILESNHNDLYTNGTNLCYINESNFSDIAQWRDATAAFDLNSLSINPEFESTANYKVNCPDLNGSAIHLDTVLTDIEGKNRSNQNPDIGAFEFNLKANDIAITELVSPELPIGQGNHDVIIQLRNCGQSSVSNISLTVELNGERESLSWNGQLESMSSISYSMGSKLFKRGKNILKFWIDGTDLGVDENHANDTLKYELYTSFSGIYTIGGINPDFSSINEAVSALKASNVIAPLVFQIRDGNYNEQIILENIEGANSTNTITFTPESGDSTKVIIEFLSTKPTPESDSGDDDPMPVSKSRGIQDINEGNFTLLLKGASYFHFAKVTLKSKGLQYGRIIDIRNSANHNTFSNCIFEGQPVSENTYEHALVYSGNFADNYNEFVNSRFENGSIAIGLAGKFESSWGEGGQYKNWSDPEIGLTITNNRFVNQYAAGIDLVNHDTLVLSSNNFRTTSDFRGYSAIVGNLIYKSSEIIKNKISLINGGTGISLFNRNDGGGVAEVYSKSRVYVQNSVVLVANNFISISGSNKSVGVLLEDVNDVRLNFNSISIQSKNNQSTALYTKYINSFVSQNNIFSNFGGGFAVNFESTWGVDESSYNNYFSNGKSIAKWGDTVCDSLKAFQNANNQDVNSISVNPYFNNPLDLHTSQIALNGKAFNATGVTDDIDGDLRQGTPDIGADEFIPSNVDAGVVGLEKPSVPFVGGINDIVLKLKNFGIENIQSLKICWEFNGVKQDTKTWTGSLSSGNEIEFIVGSPTFSNYPNQNKIKAWVYEPNGVNDGNSNNDTLSFLKYPSLSGEYTIGGVNPDFAKIADAINFVTDYGIVGNVTFKIRPGLYNEQLLVPELPGAIGNSIVTFTTESVNSKDVVISFDPTDSEFENYLLQLSGSSNTIFKNIIFENKSTSKATILELVGKINNARFINCLFKGLTDNYSSRLITVNGALINGLHLIENSFENGRSAIILEGDYSNYNNVIVISGNTFTNQSNSAIELRNANNVTIDNNSINNGGNGSFNAISLNSIKEKLNINYNNLILKYSGTGIYVSSAELDFLLGGLISNNFINLNGTYFEGINIYYSKNLNIINNTIRLNSTEDGASSISIGYGCNNITIINNILASINKGNPLYIYNRSFINECDFNDIISENGFKVKLQNYIYNSIAEWQKSTGLDNNSIAVFPSFISDNDLHVKEVLLNGVAKPTPLISLDFDHQPRNPVKPDIGADEFEISSLDAEIKRVASPIAPIRRGKHSIGIEIKNTGSDPIKAITLEWTLNQSQQTPIHWTGNINTGGNALITTDSILFQANQTYQIKLKIKSPNGLTDVNPANDTISLMVSTSLEGIYTIGGLNPDFKTITEAISRLNNAGISADVKFNLRNGVYRESVVIDSIRGAKNGFNVVFTSESKDSSKTVVEYDTDLINHLFNLRNTQNITFSNLTFRALGINQSRVFLISGNCENISVNNSILNGSITTNNFNTANSLIFAENSVLNNIQLRNNIFNNASQGIYFAGISSTKLSNINIEQNRFNNQLCAALTIYNIINPVINRNIINSNSDYYYFDALRFGGIQNGGYIASNSIFINRGNCINLSSNQNNYYTYIKVFNNFLKSKNGSGVYLYYTSFVNIYSNNILIDGGGYPLNIGYSSNSIYLANSILSNLGGGYALYSGYGNQLSSSDFNDLYSTGSSLIYCGNNFANLLQWKTQKGFDRNSFSVDPLFVSNDDLHVRQVLLKAAGSEISEITTDIDGQFRAKKPDIGADEFELLSVDAGVSSIDNIALGLSPIKAYLSNFGKNDLVSAKIGWSFDGISQSRIDWNGNLKSRDSILVTLGTKQIEPSVSYRIKSWSFEPNGIVDPIAGNDTTIVVGKIASLSGEYTIGGASPDYPTFTAAIEALKTLGISDKVIFNVRDGNYNEQIEIPQISGAFSNESILFRSESNDSSKVILQYNSSYSNNYIIRLKKAKGVMFKKIGFKPLNTSYGKIIDIQDGESITFVNCKFEGISTTSSSEDLSLIYSGSGKVDNFIFEKCYFVNGSQGISFNSQGINLKIIGNIFSNQYYRAIAVSSFSDAQIVSNSISTQSTYCCFNGIDISSCLANFAIKKNKINILNGGTGIYIRDHSSDESSNFEVSNNFINVTGFYYSSGINLYNSSNVNIYNNNINIIGNATDSKAINISDSKLRLFNNNIVNAAKGYCVYKYSSGISSSFVANNNNYYTTGTNIGYWDGNIASLTTWKAATSYDANSISINPLYKSNSDLHVSELGLIKKGLVLSEVIDDIDNDQRPLNGTTIGADEIIPLGNDAGILSLNPVKSGSSMVFAVLVNYGKDTLRSVNINWKFNSVQEAPIVWTGKLSKGDTVKINLAIKNFVSGQLYNAKIWSSLPNNGVDANNVNDTLKVPSFYSSLSGIYTIGSAGCDFNSFQSAANALESFGVYDSVEFRVKSNIYNEQVRVKRFNGPNKPNTVKFISETVNPQDVSLVYASTTSDNNFTIQFDNVSGVTFKGITIKANGANYGRAVDLKNTCENINFSNNIIVGSTSNNTSYNYSLVYSYGGLLSKIDFVSNTFLNGSYGVYFNLFKGSSGIKVIGNNFTNQYYCGGTFNYISDFQFNGNSTQASSLYSGYIGIDISNCQKSITVSNNRIIIPKGENGIKIYSCTLENADESIIANNFISIKGEYYTTGINLSSVNNIGLFYNSVYANGTGNDCSSIAFNSCSKIKNNDNNFYNAGNGYAVKLYYPDNLVESDYNNIFSDNGNLIYTNKLFKSLDEYITVNNKENHSISYNPRYFSTIDLHTNEIILNNRGKLISGIVSDIDGEVRSAQTPDIGADEFTPNLLDAGVITISTVDSLISVGNNSVYADIRNFGSDTIKTVKISWTIDGSAFDTYSWSGVLKPSEIKRVILGMKNFTFGQEHSLKAWTSLPNGMQDVVAINDSSKVGGLFTALNGTYTIGGTNPDFNNFTSAANYLIKGGVKNKVIFNVRDGLYTEQVAIPYIKGSYISDGIVFQSEGGDSTKVVLSYSANSSNNFTLQIKNGVNIDINKISFRANNTSYGHAIELINTSKINIKNCILQGVATTNSGSSMSLLYSSNSPDSAIIIKDCKFLNGSNGIYLEGNSSRNSNDISIIGNLFESQFSNAIYISNNQAPSLLRNSITMNSTYTKKGIYLYNCKKAIVVGNKIDLDNNGYGIYMNYCNSDGLNKTSIINNFISVRGLTEVYGLYLNSNQFVNIFFNSISIYSDNINSSSFYSYYDNDLNLKNNIFANLGKGYAINIGTTSSITSSDYNNLYSKGVLGYWSQNITSLESWRSVTLKDGHSLSVNPYFVSAIDLHVKEVTLNEAGIIIPGITNDIDGDTRATLHPDIGADEFKLEFNNDAGISAIVAPACPFAPGLNNVKVVLRNFGKEDLISASINWKVNNTIQTSFSWTGLIKPGEKDTVNIGTFNFLDKVRYSIESWSTQPNGVIDPFNINDTIKVSNVFPAYGGVYTIGGMNPDFITPQNAIDALKIGGIYKNVIFSIRNGGYNESIIITEIPGINKDRGLLFQSESSDSTGVILSYNSSSSSNSTLLIKNIENITFKKITIKSISSSFGRVVVLSNASNITFEGCVFDGNFTNSTSDNQNLVSSSESKGLSFINNVFRYGSYALSINNNEIVTYKKSIINKNYFKDQNAFAVYCYKQNAIEISGNIVESSKDNVTAFYLGESENAIIIEGNLINLNSGLNGIYLNNFKGRSDSQGNVYNNFVTVCSNSNVKGINTSYSRFLNVIYNNINIISNSFQSYALYQYSSDDIDIMNNNLVNNGFGNSLYFVNSGSNIISNYNNLYSKSGLVVNNGNKILNLSEWIIGKYDKQSVSVNPFYKSNSDLHVQQISLNERGTPVQEFTEDIDSEPRSLLSPDIGADEFTPSIKDDAGVISISDFELPLKPGNKKLFVVIKNYGVDTLKSAKIVWKINSEPTSIYDWRGIIPSGKTDTVLVGIYNFLHSTKYLLKSWTEKPNSLSDICAFNDTISIDNIYAGYEGVFTIGGNNPDFKSFNDAINTLKLAGINKTVLFNVRNGNYNEQFVVPYIRGISDQSRVIFTSESGDSSKVILSFNSSSNNNYIIRFDNSEYVTIKGITLKASSHYSHCVEFINSTKNILLQSNVFSGSNYYYNNELGYLISSNNPINNIIIANNRFEYGSYAFHYSSNSGQCDSLVFINNTILNSFSGGVFINKGKRIWINNNLINSNATSFTSISINNCIGVNNIYSNKIVLNSGNGIYLGTIIGDNTQSTKVYNNFISINSNNNSNGIYIEQSNYLGLYYNSINVSGSNLNSNAINLISGTNNKFFNNILCNKNGGIALRVASGIQFESDHNDLYTSGSILVKYNQDYGTLSAWKVAVSKDIRSLSVDPQFVSNNDLHSKELLFNGNAKVISDINFDIDGEIRNSLTPDIGADEIIIPSKVDAGIVALTEPVKPFKEGTTSIFAVIKNFGSDTLKSASINWKVNSNLQNVFNWRGALVSGGQDTVKIGSYFIESAIPYQMKIWSSIPNFIADTVNTNDTLLVNNIYSALGGSYTIGGLYPDFIDFNSVAKALEYGGVIDSVKFLVRKGTYNESVRIKEVTGASAIKNIKFQSETLVAKDVILTSVGSSYNNYTLCLDGADYIQFNSLTIKNTDKNYGRVIELKNGASNNSFANNVISTATTSYYSSNSINIYSQNANDHSNKFIDNFIENGYIGISLNGEYNNLLHDIIIKGNTFENQYQGAISLRYVDAPQVVKNTVSISTGSSNSFGINLISCRNKLVLSKNKINIQNGGYGLKIENCEGITTNKGLTANNFITVGGKDIAYGIYLSNCNLQNIYYNNVNIISTDIVDGRALYCDNGANNQLYNNIFCNHGGGYSIYTNNPLSIAISNFNNIYTTGTNLGYWGKNCRNLVEWRLETEKDQKSFSIEPLFETITDLHVKEIYLKNSGTPVSEVTDDIDGESRDEDNPDIGADEFYVPARNDAGIISITNPSSPFRKGNSSINVVLRNFGYKNLSSVDIEWEVNNISQVKYRWNGDLLPGKSDTVNIGLFNFIDGKEYEFAAWTKDPNNITDIINVNDTTHLSNLYTALEGTYTIGGVTPNYKSINNAVFYLNHGGVVGPVTFNIRSGIFKEKIAIQQILGASEINKILFISEARDSSSVMLLDSLGGPAIQLDGSDYITLSHISINKYRSNGNVIDFINGARNNRLVKCNLRNDYPDYWNKVINLSVDQNDNNQFINNRIVGGGYGIYLKGSLKYIQNGNIVDNNIFIGQRTSALYLEYQNSPDVNQNSISSSSNIALFKGCNIVDCYGNLKVTKNRITQEGDGICLSIESFKGSTSQQGLVANNFVAIGGTSESKGIYSANNSYLNIVNNSVNVFNSSTNSGALKLYNGDNNSFINNILVNSGNGYSINLYSLNGIKTLDYNNIFSTGTTLAILGQTKFSDLESFRLQTNFDINSISIEPLFTSNADLHISQIALDSSGVRLPYVLDDIDGEVRNIKKPDIGADEFRNTNHDLSITSVAQNSGCLLTNNEPISIIIKNYGAYSENGFNVSYRIDDKDPVVETINQTIPAGKAINYTFNKKADFSAIRSYIVKVSAQLANDDRPKNDSTSITTYSIPRLNIKLTKDTSICKGANIVLTASGADKYFWNTGETTSSIYVNPKVLTRYIVTASTSYNNCLDIDTVIVGVRELPKTPIITASGPINFCNGDNVVLSSSFSKNNIWSNGEKTQLITVRHSGNYNVTYKDSTGCSATSSTINTIEEPAATITPASITVCTNDSVLIKVDNAASYLWSTGQTKPYIKVSPETTSAITVTGLTPLGCKYSLSSNVNVLPVKIPGIVDNMVPSDLLTGLSFPVELSWLPAKDASSYDLYIWNDKQPRPNTPYRSNISSIRYTFDPKTIAGYGTTYKWQVVSKYYECASTPGTIQKFSLRYLPDLMISNVQAPVSAYTGQKIEITWNVKNQGLGNTMNQQWVDQVSLNIDTVYDGFHVLGRLPNMTYLEPNQSYSKRASLTLPKYKDGLFNVFSLTDINNNILETNDRNNDGYGRTPMWVKLAPPPDLYVSEILTPLDFFSEDAITISWTVTNKGKWFTEAKGWTDRVYISQDFDKAQRYFIGNFYHSSEIFVKDPVAAMSNGQTSSGGIGGHFEIDSLMPGESYRQTASVTIPEAIFGKYYIYVETDIYNNVYEHAYDGNNISQSDSVNVILRPPADLKVNNVLIPKSVTNIEYANIKWQVANIGNSSPRDSKWTDVVYLSKSPKFDLNKAISFSFDRTKVPYIPRDYSYSNSEYVKIPNFIEAGDYYVYVKTDAWDEVFEYLFEGNNIIRSDTTMKITIAPWPDLQVTSFAYPDSAGAGEVIPIQYTITNKGTADTKGTWEDRIYISLNNADCPKGVALKTIQRTTSLKKDSSYTVNALVTLPGGFLYGSNRYCISIYTDVNESVYEHTGDKNNDRSGMIFIKPSDLAVTTHNIPAVFYSGSYLDVNFVIKNEGTASTPDNEWIDKVELLDSNFVSLTTKPFENEIFRGGLIKPGTAYSYQKSVLIPDGIFGKYYIQLRTDIRNDNNERVTSNNVKLVPVKIILREPTDLIVNSFNIPQTGIAGQPVTIQWNIKNTGPGVTLARRWVDRIYLSEDNFIDANDILLGSFAKTGGLTTGESYSRSEQVFLPISAVGNYVVIIMTDFPENPADKPFGEEYEYKADDNNTINSLITINLPAPSDLIVTSIITPSNSVAGEPVTVSWTIKNIGVNKAKGYLTDMVYFSRDSVWDIGDPFFGEKQVLVDLAPGKETSLTLTTELTGTSVGDYFVLVKADNKNNIYEVSDLNNTLSSNSAVNVDVPLLPLFKQVTKDLVNDKVLYYKLEIPDSLVNETLLITMKGDSIFGDNYLYLSFDKVPDRSDFEFSSKKPFAGNQELIVPSLQKGTYYLLVYGQKTNGSTQSIKLFAGKINFQIRSVQANEGGNTGKITVEMYGAKFNNDMIIMLKNEGTTIIAEKSIFIDPTKVFVTFNLKNAPLGLYDVIAINTKADTAALLKGFKVVETSPFGLVSSVKAPGAMRVGTIGIVAVQYANDGNIDLAIPKFKLISDDGAPISFLRKDLGLEKVELDLEFREINGPQDVLRPGAVNTIYIWVFANSAGVKHFHFE